MKRYASLSLLLAVVGCGNTTSNPATDGSTPSPDLVTPGTDGGTGGDMATAATVTGTKIAGGSYDIIGITSDDNVVAFDIKTNALVAAAVGGTTAKSVDPMVASAGIRGKVVFAWDAVDQNSGVGVGNYWTAASANLVNYSQSTLAGIADATADVSYVFYSDNASSDGTTTDLVVAKGDNSSPHTFLKGVENDPTAMGGCSPDGRFTAAGKLVLAYCLAPTADGGTPDGGAAMETATLVVVDPATGTVTPLGTGLSLNGFVLDASGTKILALDPNNKLLLFSTSGGNPVTIDTGVSTEFAFTPDGNSVIYRTGDASTAGAIKKASASATPAPSTIVATGVQFLQFWRDANGAAHLALSPDGKYVLYSTMLDMSGVGDLQLVPVAGGSPVAIATSGAVLFGDPFTGDSSKVIWISNVAVSMGGLVGKLNVTPVAGGTATAISAKATVWVNYLATGTVVVYNDNWKPAGKGVPNNGTADLKVVDVAAASPTSKVIATAGSADIWLTNKHDKVIFGDAQTGVQPGIYAAPTTP